MCSRQTNVSYQSHWSLVSSTLGLGDVVTAVVQVDEGILRTYGKSSTVRRPPVGRRQHKSTNKTMVPVLLSFFNVVLVAVDRSVLFFGCC